MAASRGHVRTIQYLVSKMESLLHSTSNLGFTMLHYAAQEGQAEVVRIAIDDYKLDPNALSKVCVRHAGVLQRAVGPVVGCVMEGKIW